jgi:flagellar motor switch/type III secretory pathway protein FliN
MPELNFSSVDSFTAAVKNGAEESASAFTRTFGATVTLEPKEGGKFNVEDFTAKLNEKGLALLLQVGAQGIAVLIPASTGLVPDWCDNPDATGKSKLSTFAQEWAMNLVPEDFVSENQQAAVLRDLSQGLLRAMPELDAGYLEFLLGKEDGTSASAYLVWALSAPEKLLDDPKPTAEEIPQAPPMDVAPPTFGGEGGQADPFAGANFGTPNFVGGGGMPQHHRLEDLPGYTRSALKVKVPVATILARARKPIKTVLELGVGSIIQFEKSCEEMLEIEVGQTIVIATAEAVKVGDKFGFRISSVRLPEERFRRVEVRREGEYHVKSDSPQVIGKAPIKSFDQSGKN